MNRITKSRHPPTKPLVGGKYISIPQNEAVLFGWEQAACNLFWMWPGISSGKCCREEKKQWHSICLFLGNHIWLQWMDGLGFAMTACPGPPGIICLKRHKRHRNGNRKWLKGGMNLSPGPIQTLREDLPFTNGVVFIQVPQKCKGVRKFNTNMHLIAIVWKDSFSQSFWLHFPSCLRSVHRWWSHVHGAARRGRSWTKMHMNRISSLEEWKECHISKLFSNQVMLLNQWQRMMTFYYCELWTGIDCRWGKSTIVPEEAFFDISWHCLTLHARLEPCPGGPPTGTICLKIREQRRQTWKKITLYSFIATLISYSWWKGSLQ